LLLFCLGAVVLFFPILGRTFASDDFQVIRRVGIDRTIQVPGFFRPLSDITLYGNYLLGGFRPAGYYLFNILIHGVNSWLVFIFCFRWKWTEERRLQRAYALLAGLFFLAYPFHSEGIDWVIGRGASLTTFFGLAALVVLSGRMSSAPKLWWVAILYFTGMAAYEPVIVLPPIALLVLYTSGATRREIMRWGAVFSGTFLLHLLVRMVVSGSITGEYGFDFFSSGWLRYAGNAGKVAGRLFLPPGEEIRRMLLLFPVVLAALGVGLVLFYRRTREATAHRAYLAALLLMVGISCILPILAGVSTKTSESDRLLYFPSVFLCCGLSFLLVGLLGYGVRLKVAAVLLLGYMVVFLEKGNLNWMGASAITRNILQVTGRQPAGRKLFIINLPDEKDGAYIFRLGLPEAVLLSGRDTAGLVIMSHLTREQWLATPDSTGVERTGGIGGVDGHGWEIYIAPAIMIRRWGRDSLWIERNSVAGKEKQYWLAGKEDRLLYWNKKGLEVLVPQELW
jgi:hypothetical protein